jgi:hypothetical protein
MRVDRTDVALLELLMCGGSVMILLIEILRLRQANARYAPANAPIQRVENEKCQSPKSAKNQVEMGIFCGSGFNSCKSKVPSPAARLSALIIAKAGMKSKKIAL